MKQTKVEDTHLAVVVPAYNELGVGRTLQSLHDQRMRDDGGVMHIVVDNGSTDDTRARVEQFAREHDGFPLQIVDEPGKGTGRAADTGFRYAIEHGAGIVARTDADTLPRFDWTSRIYYKMTLPSAPQLVSGLILPIHDKDYRRGDSVLMPVASLGARAALAISHGDVRYLRGVTGGNMAVNSDAYEQAGGFPRTRIEDLDEDIAFALRVYDRFGWGSINFDPSMVVRTSMRRVRHMGWAGTALHHLASDRSVRYRGVADIR